MASVNKVILIGNVGRDPEIRYFESGDAVANFPLATSEKWTSKSGEKQERTEWHKVEVFGKTAEVVRDYVLKGKPLYVEGSIRTEKWTDKDGNDRYTTKVRVQGPNSRIVLLGSKNGSAGASSGPADNRTSEPADDDLPF
jgi:single-strand DNA-binding protein